VKIDTYLRFMAEKKASDLFLATGAVPSVKIEGELYPVSEHPLQSGVVSLIADDLMSADQKTEFAENLEMNVGFSLENIGRFRVNIFRQRGEVSIVIRYIKLSVATIEELGLPYIVKDFVMKKNGLVLVVGSTGSGKSTTLASMVEARNAEKSGHILTIEDPIEFAFSHRKSIVSQREVGIDTLSYANALREALRESPDVIMIGEIRDRESMQAAINLSDTGHLVLATLHAVNANQALDRIVNLFPRDNHPKLFQDLSLSLNAIVSQRLVRGENEARVPAVEVLINTPYVSELIAAAKVSELKDAMESDTTNGMQTFDQSLIDLFRRGTISNDEALSHADSPNNIKWQLNYGVDLTAEHSTASFSVNEVNEKASQSESSIFELRFDPK